jgi:hypothetical protein
VPIDPVAAEKPHHDRADGVGNAERTGKAGRESNRGDVQRDGVVQNILTQVQSQRGKPDQNKTFRKEFCRGRGRIGQTDHTFLLIYNILT